MRDFWRNSGFHLLERDAAGFLVPGETYFRAYLVRPELIPVAESCDAERALHQRLVDDPAQAVSDADLAGFADLDARENYQVFLAFRDALISAGSLERCYLAMFGSDRPVRTPMLFIDQMVHAMARNIFADATDPFVLRAAEMLFREQVINRIEGAVLLMDAETVDMMRTRETQGHFSLIDIANNPALLKSSSELDVMAVDNQDGYWQRSDRFDFALDLTFGRRGHVAFAEALQMWIGHFLKIGVAIEPLERIDDAQWVWHVGLDRNANDLLNDLYNGKEIAEDRFSRLLSLFRLTFDTPGDQRADIAGRPVYLALCGDGDGRVRIKPQNILVNLPLSRQV